MPLLRHCIKVEIKILHPIVDQLVSLLWCAKCWSTLLRIISYTIFNQSIFYIWATWISSFSFMYYPTYLGTGLLYWNLGTEWMSFTLTCKRLLIEFHMLAIGWFLKLGQMEFMENCYCNNGMKIFYPTEDCECTWVTFQIGWTNLVEYRKEVCWAPFYIFCLCQWSS